MQDFYCYLRKHVGLVLIGGAAVTVAFLPHPYDVLAMVVWGIVTLYLAIRAQMRTSAISRMFGGQMLEFVFAPTPLGSLFESLAKHGVQAEKVASIDLMSADIGESMYYYENGDGHGSESFLATLRRCPNIKLNVFGRATRGFRTPDGIHIHTTKERHTEHTNLVTTNDGQNFVWYEPYHNVVNGKHYFKRGAYLFQVDKDTAERIRSQLSQIPLAA